MQLCYVGKLLAGDDGAVVFCNGIDESGNSHYYYIGLRGEMVAAITDAIKHKKDFDLSTGIILKDGKGIRPSHEEETAFFQSYGMEIAPQAAL